MEFSEINLSLGEIRDREQRGVKKRLEITKELDDLFDRMVKEKNPDARDNIRGEIDQILRQRRRIFEDLGKSGKEEIQEYYERLRRLQRDVS